MKPNELVNFNEHCWYLTCRKKDANKRLIKVPFPKTNMSPPENRASEKGRPSSSNHQSSGVKLAGFVSRRGSAILCFNFSWWFQPIWKILVKLEIFPNFRAENKTYLKPPPRSMVFPTVAWLVFEIPWLAEITSWNKGPDHSLNHQTFRFRYVKWRVHPHRDIRCMDTAYVREKNPPPK